MAETLESYSSHLEPGFVKLKLPPTAPNQSIPLNFDLSENYVNQLDAEFARVYEEYTRRCETVREVATNIIDLWAELGIPQSQTDPAILKFYRDSPEQLGLLESDIARLCSKRDKLVEEKKNRERRLQTLKSQVEALWEKLEVDEEERKAFLNNNRGCGLRQINEFEDELARLNELKRQNLHIFVEDARTKLQELWDALFFSEDEMLEFTPAFSDVYSDALLEAHEREIERLEHLKEQRAPCLSLIEKHKGLLRDKEELEAASQDASRLMSRGQKGEKRDPGKLLREEKMRKRIAKELPKVTAELRKVLEQWEDEYGRPFLVHGERYLDILEAEEPKPGPGPRSRTPGPNQTPGAGSKTPSAAASGLNRAKSVGHITGNKQQPITKPAGAKTPIASATSSVRSTQGLPFRTTIANKQGSPTRLPARVPLSNLKHGNNSPERPRPESRGTDTGSIRSVNGLLRAVGAAPPKMRELLPAPDLDAPVNHYRTVLGASIVRQVEPEDPYGGDTDRYSLQENSRPESNASYYHHAPSSFSASTRPRAQTVGTTESSASSTSSGSSRQMSNISSSSTVVTGSENWETYDDDSAPEPDASDMYFAKLRAARRNQHQQIIMVKQRGRGIPPPAQAQAQAGAAGGPDGSKSGGSEWTDEDAL